MQNIRVYIAIETFFPLVGGSEKQAFLQSKYLLAQGIEPTIITLRFLRDWPECEDLEGVSVLRVAGRVLAWYAHLPRPLRRACYLLALLTMGWQLWRQRHKYDVLHVFQLTIFTLPALVACRLAHKPLIIAMRCDSTQLEGARPEQRRYRRVWADLDGLVRLGKPALRLINYHLRSTQARIVILSDHMRESLSRYGFNGASIRLIPNGVDTIHFRPQSEEVGRALTVVCVARMCYQKGIDILLRAWCDIAAQFPEARLVLVGDGPLIAPLQHLTGELGIASSVEFVGLRTDVPRQLQRGSIAVLPSRWEGMPNALLEAMACGLACVATRVSGSEDLLLQGTRGLLVEPEDSKGLAAALLLLLREPELVRHHGQAARQHVERYYAFGRIMDRHIELYREVIAESGKVG